MMPTDRADPFPAALFASVCERYPDRLAIKGDGLSLSYAQLERRTARRAAWLATCGVGRLDRVGILVADPCEFIECVVACVRLGAVYVPIDAHMQPAAMRAAVETAGVRHLVTDGDEPLSGLGVAILHAPPETFEANGIAPDPGAQDPAEPVCIMFTSGSTGVPKGVICPLGGVVPLVTNDGHLAILPDDVVVQVSAREFDAFTWEVWGALLNGACLHLLPHRWSIAQLGQQIAAGGVTAAFFTARLFDLLVESAPETLAKMRLIGFGGEAASPRHCAMARQLYPKARLINGYGPTENTTFTCSYALGDGADSETMVPIGTPRNGDITLLLDSDTLEPVEGTDIGELFVGGPGVAIGYTDAALTAERFITHPLSGIRLFRTNDMVRRLPSGEFHYLGRRDRLVKVRGYRVDLSEVERALCLHPDVLGAHVVFETMLDRQELIAFVRMRSRKALDRKALLAFLDGKIDSYAVPNWFEPVEELPLKGNGKADTAQLISRFRNRVVEAPASDPIAALWGRLLFPAQINERSHFFDEGGDSFSALNLILETERTLGIKLPADYVDRFPVLADFRDHLARADKASLNASLIDPPEAPCGQSLFVFVPWLGGKPDVFAHVAPALAVDGPVVTLDMSQLEARDDIATVADISRLCADAIAALKPSSVSLAGPSLGGAVALDLGAELLRRRIAVHNILILDGYAPWLIGADKLLQFVKDATVGLRGKRSAAAPEQRSKVRASGRQLHRPERAPLLTRMLDRLGGFSNFAPRIPMARQICLIEAETNISHPLIRRVPMLGWKRAIPDLRLTSAPGDHMSMLGPVHGPALAGIMSDLLAPHSAHSSETLRALAAIPSNGAKPVHRRRLTERA